MAKFVVLDDRAKRALNQWCRSRGYNFPLGDWIGQVNEVLEALRQDQNVEQERYEDLDEI